MRMRTCRPVHGKETAAALEEAIASDLMTVIVSKCDSGNVDVPVVPLDPVQIKERVMIELEKRKGRYTPHPL